MTSQFNMPIVRRINSPMFAKTLINIQPMSAPSSSLFYMNDHIKWSMLVVRPKGTRYLHDVLTFRKPHTGIENFIAHRDDRDIVWCDAFSSMQIEV